MSTDLPVPEGASCLAPFVEASGNTSLLVAGNGLHHFTSIAAGNGDASTKLSYDDDTLFSGVKQLSVCQSPSYLSVWALNGENSLVYQEFEISSKPNVQRTTPSRPLLTYGEGGGRFATMMNPQVGQSLFVIGKTGQLRRLEQDQQTRLWSSHDIKVATLDDFYEINTYTTNVRLKGSDGAPLCNTELLLSCSNPTSVIVNGFELRVNAAGQAVKTDTSGKFTIILESDDISSPIFTLRESPTASYSITNCPYFINPLDKLNEALSKIQTGSQLRDIKLEGGESLVSKDMKDEDLEKAAKALQDLVKVSNQFAQSDKDSIISNQCEVLTTTDASIGTSWDLFEWVGNKISGAFDWVVEKIKGVWTFVVRIGKDVFNFVIDCFKQAAKAIWKVLVTIGAGLKKLVKFIGFLFAWDDILSTRTMIVNIANLGMLYGIDELKQFDGKTQAFMAELKQKAASLDPTKMEKVILGKEVAKKNDGPPAGKENIQSAVDSPGADFGTYQTSHGGASTASSSKSKKEQQEGSDTLQRFTSQFNKVSEQLEVLFDQLGDDIVGLFKDQDHSIGDLFARMGSRLLVNGISAFATMIDGLFGILGDILVEVAAASNTVVKIPVLSALYKRFTGNELTVLDAAALIIAIPTTIIFKVIRQEAPSKMKGCQELSTIDLYSATLRARLTGKQNEISNLSNTSRTAGSKNMEAALPLQPPENAMYTHVSFMQAIPKVQAKSNVVLSKKVVNPWTKPSALVQAERMSDVSAVKPSSPPIAAAFPPSADIGKIFWKTLEVGQKIWTLTGPAILTIIYGCVTIKGFWKVTNEADNFWFSVKGFFWLVTFPLHFGEPGYFWRVADWLACGIHLFAGLVPLTAFQNLVGFWVNGVRCLFVKLIYDAQENAEQVIDEFLRTIEYMQNLARIFTAIAGGSLGTEPFTVVGGPLLTLVSASMKTYHAVDHWHGRILEPAGWF